ncbi:MAG: hypothetical protein IJY92_02310 [Alphaproteobacteria bacterium]|nr:hypothetical protein [Alphaproteobacteria bacterium]
MTSTQPIELNRRNLQNGHVVITYKKDGLIFYDEYLSADDASERNKEALISRAYAKKNKLGRNMLVYIDANAIQTTPSILKVLTYDKQNKLSEEIIYDKQERKTLSRFYVNGMLDQDWTYDPNTGHLTLGLQYKKNEKGRYDVVSVSTPIYAQNGDLSHTIQRKATSSGELTGEVLQRVFYLCNLPFVKVTYIENPEDPKRPFSQIYSLDDGQWTLVTNTTLKKHLIPILEDAVSIEGEKAPKRKTLEKYSNIHFEELTYADVLAFKKINPSVQILAPNQIGYIPSEEEKQLELKKLSHQERQFVEKALNAGYFVSLTPLEEK